MNANGGQRQSGGRHDRGDRRRLRRAARLHHRRLPRLQARADRDLRRGHEPRRDLPAVRLEPRADRAALGVRVALPARRLADLRPDRRLGTARPQPAAALGRAQVQPRRARDPRGGRDRHPPARLPGASARRAQGRLGRARARSPTALHALRRGRQRAWTVQARDHRDRPRPARLPRRLRQGTRGSARRRSGGAGLRAQALLPRRALPRAGHRASRRSTSGPTPSTRARRASPCAATRPPTSRTSTSPGACSTAAASTRSRS